MKVQGNCRCAHKDTVHHYRLALLDFLFKKKVVFGLQFATNFVGFLHCTSASEAGAKLALHHAAS